MRSVLMCFLLFSSAFACQESCLERASRGDKAILLNIDRQPLKEAGVVIRSAEGANSTPKTFCGRRKGKLLKSVKTGADGSFSLGGLRDGWYWVTFSDIEDGESFLIQVQKKRAPREPLTLVVNGYVGSLCYVVDIERNATKPAGWPSPVYAEGEMR